MTQRQPRILDHKYLCWLHTKPCCLTGLTPVDAAHIRYGNEFYDKRPTGMGEKPDDKWCLPVVRSKHTEQHSMNEQEFWRKHNIDPLALAQRYYAEYLEETGASRIIQPRKQRQSRKPDRQTYAQRARKVMRMQSKYKRKVSGEVVLR